MTWTFQPAIRPDPPRSRLLDLPPELRDTIFEYLFIASKPVVTFRLDTYQRDSLQEAVPPALTQVNRQLRHETLPVWYTSNIFVLHTEDGKCKEAQRWLTLHEAHLAKVNRISLWVRYHSPSRDQPSHGALAIPLRKHITDDIWQVSDAWEWITVVQEPSDAADDAEALIRRARSMLACDFRTLLRAHDIGRFVGELRTFYAGEKAV